MAKRTTIISNMLGHFAPSKKRNLWSMLARRNPIRKHIGEALKRRAGRKDALHDVAKLQAYPHADKNPESQDYLKRAIYHSQNIAETHAVRQKEAMASATRLRALRHPITMSKRALRRRKIKVAASQRARAHTRTLGGK